MKKEAMILITLLVFLSPMVMAPPSLEQLGQSCPYCTGGTPKAFSFGWQGDGSYETFGKIAQTEEDPCKFYQGPPHWNPAWHTTITIKKDTIEWDVMGYKAQEGESDLKLNFPQPHNGDCTQRFGAPEEYAEWIQGDNIQNCQQACEDYQTSFISTGFDNVKRSIVGQCSNGYNFDDKSRSSTWGASNYIKNIIQTRHGLSVLPETFVWQPKEIKDDDDLNGQNYCYQEYGARGFDGDGERGEVHKRNVLRIGYGHAPIITMDYNVRKGSLISGDISGDNGKHDDCVCWIEIGCFDEDKDKYGDGRYLGKCKSLEEDCVDEDSKVNFDKSPLIKEFENNWEGPNKEAKISEIKKTFKDAMMGFIDRVEDRDSVPFQITLGDEDDRIADEISPGKKETINLYSTVHFLTNSKIMSKALWITACNDGIDNDCDGHVDCFDEDCYPSTRSYQKLNIERKDILDSYYETIEVNVCEGTCGEACIKADSGTVAAHCLTIAEYEKLSGERSHNPNSLKTLPEEGYSDCTYGKSCVCEIGECDAVCKREFERTNNGIGITGSHKLFEKTSKKAEKREKDTNTCYFDKKSTSTLKDKINVYEKFVQTAGPQEACCCDMCEKTEEVILIPSSLITKLKIWVGKNLLKIPANIDQQTKEARIIPTEHSGDKPERYDSLMPVLKQKGGGDQRLLHALFCEEVVEHLLKVDETGGDDKRKQYGLYSGLALTMLLEESPDLFSLEKFKIAIDKKDIELVLPTIKKDYEEGTSDLISRAFLFITSEIGYNMLHYRTNNYAKEGCKLCWPVPDIDENGKSHFKSSSNSYFVFSDMIQGTYYGQGYAVTPHDMLFQKEYELIYENPSYIYKFDQEEFENCVVEPISEPSTVMLQTGEATITYENMTFKFPQDSVSEETELSIKKISFDCTQDYNLFIGEEEEVEHVTTLDLMIAAKNWIEEPTLWEKFYRILNIWSRN
jgi:hypothetical protein